MAFYGIGWITTFLKFTCGKAPGPRLRVAIQAFWTWRSEGRGGALGAGRVWVKKSGYDHREIPEADEIFILFGWV